MLDQHLDHHNLFIYQDQEQVILQVEVEEVILVLDQPIKDLIQQVD